VAIIFVVFMAMVLLLASMLMNVGEIAAMRTDTSNATDAGALAAASWIASEQNKAREIEQQIQIALAEMAGLTIVAVGVALLLGGPALLILLFGGTGAATLAGELKKLADAHLRFGWINAQYAAHLFAWNNANLADDPNGHLKEAREKEREELRQTFQPFWDDPEKPIPIELSESITTLEWNRAPMEQGRLDSFVPSFNVLEVKVTSNPPRPPTLQLVAGFWPVGIEDGDGTITVTVTYYRGSMSVTSASKYADGELNPLDFWSVRYPKDGIRSSATAQYKGLDESPLPTLSPIL
jgi:hypothetical protein